MSQLHGLAGGDLAGVCFLFGQVLVRVDGGTIDRLRDSNISYEFHTRTMK